MKTYSIAILVKRGYWVTNFHKYFDLSDINWQSVADWCKQEGNLVFGYYYGHKSNELTSPRCRTEIARVI